MIKVTKIELFVNNNDDEPEELEKTKQCTTGRIYVRWIRYGSDVMCTELRLDSPEESGHCFTGRYYKRLKMYFENGYVWDTLLKEEDEWRRMIFEELNRFVESGYEDLPGNPQSEMSRAARLLDDDMMYEI